MKTLIALILLAFTVPLYAAQPNEVRANIYLSLAKRCDYCDPLAKMSVVGTIKPDDYYGYGLVAQNTDNVYRWHDLQALNKIWSMNFGLYHCSGNFEVGEAGSQSNLFIKRLDSCRGATPAERSSYKNK